MILMMTMQNTTSAGILIIMLSIFLDTNCACKLAIKLYYLVVLHVYNCAVINLDRLLTIR